jgi:acetylornithine deacetylase/succinyl-diaminopimelate desuccinylase-like protein
MHITDQLITRVLDLAVAIQQIPAPTFSEGQRAEFLRERFREEGLREVSIEGPGNVYACLPGTGAAPPVVVSAHLDSIFPASTALTVQREAERIYGPGIGDNAMGLAGLLGLTWVLRHRRGKSPRLAGDLWLVADTGEEGLGDLRGMRAVLERFGRQALAYVVLEGMSLGQIYHRALGVQRYRIHVHTGGGHAWVDYGRPSAINEAATLITRLAAMHMPDKPRCTLNIGVVRGGMSINTIAPEAWFELDLRSESAATLKKLVKAVEQEAQSIARKDVQVSIEVVGRRPAGELPEAHPLVQLARRSLLALGIQPTLAVGSTDANAPLSQGLPSICLGITTGHGAHTLDEYINTRPVSQGLEQIAMVVEGAFLELT